MEAHWRGHLFKALEAWHTEFNPTKKHASKSAGKAAYGVGIDEDREFINVCNFEEPLADGAPPAGAVARAGLAAGAAGH